MIINDNYFNNNIMKLRIKRNKSNSTKIKLKRSDFITDMFTGSFRGKAKPEVTDDFDKQLLKISIDAFLLESKQSR